MIQSMEPRPHCDFCHLLFSLHQLVTGELYSWGYGVLGHGKEVSFSKRPRKIEEFSSIDDAVSTLICGPESCGVVTGLY